jgi:LytS/YehU family sensor histidine kinase
VLWYAFARHSVTDWDVVFKATALCVVCVVFITHTYETVFLIRSWGSDRTRSESLEQARIKAELEALKNQIDPHFIFNSLNTLSHLIESDPAKAKRFNEHLADVYRYILLNKERDLVLLREELDFVDHYFSLLRIRFSDAMDLRIDFNGTAAEHYLLPPISLQVLIENAVKHNEFSDTHPIRMNLRLENESIVVSNKLRSKKGSRPSSRVGLKNLNERYKVVTGMGIDVRDDHETFEVRLPLLKLNT